jgi:hypothetical protein
VPSLTRLALSLLLLPVLLAAAPPAAPSLEDSIPDTFEGVERVVAVGDVHGDAEALAAVLRLAGLIDEKGHWSGGKTHLVQTGDVPDRGDHTRAAFELLMRLEGEALAAGGRVHALLGNHEVMNMKGDLRYVTPGELASFADQSATPDKTFTAKGTNGHREAYGPQGRYGRWLRARPAVVRINGTLFMHGGLAPVVPGKTLAEVNRWVRQDLFPGHPPGGGVDAQGPLWFRGYALGADEPAERGLDEVLERFGAKRMVMGHTTDRNGKIRVRFGGKAVFIDTGLGSYYGRNLAALEIRGDTLTALYPTGRVTLVESKADAKAGP